MRKIKVKELTVDRFRAYGEFYDFINPSGKHKDDILAELYRLYATRKPPEAYLVLNDEYS